MRVNREKLLTALRNVQPGLASKDIIDQADCFVFHAGCVWTFNDRIAVCAQTQLDIEGAIVAEELFKLLTKLSQDEIEVLGAAEELILRAGRTKAGIRLQEELVLPLDEIKRETDEGTKWSKLPKNFAEAVGTCIFSAGKDATRPLLTCLSVEKDRIVSCDNERLTTHQLDGKIKKPFLLPADAAKDLGAYQVTHYVLTESWVHLRGEAVCFSARIMEGDYPSVDFLLEAEGPEVELPEELPEILDRCGIFAKGEFIQDTFVSVRVSEGRVQISGEGPQGWIKESADCSYEGDAFEFAIHPEFLAQMISHVDSVIVGEAVMKMEVGDFVHAVSLLGE